MKYQFDSHVHSIGSGHAYSTIAELAKAAKKKRLKLIAITDHGPALPGSSHIFNIANLKVVPEKLFGIEVLKGAEVNIVDYEGGLDVEEKRLKVLDIVLAGYHDACIEPGSVAENTEGLFRVMENPLVDIIVHPGNPRFSHDMEKVVKKAKETGTLLEINNSSFWISREGSLKNCVHIAELCKKYEVPVIVGSDAHIADYVGDFSKAAKVLSQIGMPDQLIMNRSADALKDYLRKKGKERFQ